MCGEHTQAPPNGLCRCGHAVRVRGCGWVVCISLKSGQSTQQPARPLSPCPLSRLRHTVVKLSHCPPNALSTPRLTPPPPLPRLLFPCYRRFRISPSPTPLPSLPWLRADTGWALVSFAVPHPPTSQTQPPCTSCDRSAVLVRGNASCLPLLYCVSHRAMSWYGTCASCDACRLGLWVCSLVFAHS